MEKLLEDAGIKLSSVASDITGVSGRAMLEALIAGQRDPAMLADLAQRRLRSKIPGLTEALTGRFSEHHAFLARVHLDLIDRNRQPSRLLGRDLPRQVQRVRRTGQVDQNPTWQSLPQGRPRRGGDVNGRQQVHLSGRQVPAHRLVSWTDEGNRRHRHAMLIAIWNMTATGALYDDPGIDFYTRRNPDKTKRRAIEQLRLMGYTVTLEPTGYPKGHLARGNLRVRALQPSAALLNRYVPDDSGRG